MRSFFDGLGGVTTVTAILANVENWLFSGQINAVLTLVLGLISIPYIIYKAINEFRRFRDYNKAKKANE